MTITGVVKDQSGEPLIGVNVMEKGTTNGSITDVDGKYSVSVKGGKTILVFSYIGYISQEIPVGNQKTLNVTMKEDTEELEEVVVIGYGTAKKKDLTGAISRVKAEKMEVEAPRSVQDLLRASAAGLSISMSTDAAGTADLQVRGKNSLKAGSSPLLVLDGVIYDGSLQDINPMDIESIDVLKDASSVAVYGAKAANGVVAITTKKGKTGKPVISFNANVGMVSNARLPKTVDGAGFIKFRQEYGESLMTEAEMVAQPGKFADPRNLAAAGIDPLAWYNYDQQTPVSALPDEKTMINKWLTRLNFKTIEIENYLNGVETDWDDIVYQTGLQQDYTVSLSNRKEDFSYYWSMGYADREGVKVGDRYRNLRTRLNLESKVTSFLTVGLNAQFATRLGGYLAADVEQREHNSPFTTNDIDILDSPYRMYPSGDNNTKNPFFDNLYRDRRDIHHDLNANLYAIVKLPFGFEYQMNFTPRYHWYEYMNHESAEHPEWAGDGGRSERKNEKTFTIFTMKFRYLVFISILSFCLACQGKKKATLSDLPRPVRVIKVEALGTFNHQYTGTVTARNFSILAFRLPGTLTEVNVNTGQKIKKGTVIARIDPYDYQRQYQTALANYKTTESIYERNQRLYAANAVAKQNLEIAQTDYIQATSALNMARRTLDYTVLTAPFDGFIEQRFVENHEEILTGQSVVRLVDPKDIEVNFMLPETSIQLLDIPKKIYVEFDSQKGKLFTTEVKEYIYSSNGSGIPVTLLITDKQFAPYRQNVFPGFSCKVIVEVDNMISDKFVLPASALQEAHHQEYVWIVDPASHTAHRQQVRIKKYNDHILVEAGLNPDDLIIIAGIASIREGQKVRPVKNQ